MAQEASVKALNSPVRSCAWTSPAILAGRIEIGNCNARRMSAKAEATASKAPIEEWM